MVSKRIEPRRAGRPPQNQGPTLIVSLRLPREVVEKIDQLAQEETRSRTNFCEVLLVNAMNAWNGTAQKTVAG